LSKFANNVLRDNDCKILCENVLLMFAATTDDLLLELNPREKDHPVFTLEDMQKGDQNRGDATNSRRAKRGIFNLKSHDLFLL